MSTILDVEKKSGVSKSTISRYLNGKNVTEENRVRIEKAIKELDYRINPLASGLKTKKTKVVGVVIPDISEPFFPPIVRRLEKRLREQGYQTLINNYGDDTLLEKTQVEVLVNQRVDGLILVSSCQSGEHVQACMEKGIPVVMLDRVIEGLECDTVTVDNYQASYDAVSLAIRKGHRKIAIMRVNGGFSPDQQRYRGYVDALNGHNIEIRPEYMVFADIAEDDAKRQFMFLMNLPEPPTLIYCTNANLSVGGFAAILEFGLKVPDDISVLSFDRLSSLPYYSFVHSIHPEFSSICQPMNLLAEEAANLLLQRIENNTNYETPIRRELRTNLFMTDSIKDLRTGRT